MLFLRDGSSVGLEVRLGLPLRVEAARGHSVGHPSQGVRIDQQQATTHHSLS